MKKTIITVVGKDTVGIIAKVCNYLAENQVNIEDISQTIVPVSYTHLGQRKTLAGYKRRAGFYGL